MKALVCLSQAFDVSGYFGVERRLCHSFVRGCAVPKSSAIAKHTEPAARVQRGSLAQLPTGICLPWPEV